MLGLQHNAHNRWPRVSSALWKERILAALPPAAPCSPGLDAVIIGCTLNTQHGWGCKNHHAMRVQYACSTMAVAIASVIARMALASALHAAS